MQTTAQNKVKNSMAQRTEGCIALFPVGNAQGSVKFLHLASNKVITRDHWTPLPMPDSIIELLNSKSMNPNANITKEKISDLKSVVLRIIPLILTMKTLRMNFQRQK